MNPSYLQPYYSNGVFSNVYLLALDVLGAAGCNCACVACHLSDGGIQRPHKVLNPELKLLICTAEYCEGIYHMHAIITRDLYTHFWRLKWFFKELFSYNSDLMNG